MSDQISREGTGDFEAAPSGSAGDDTLLTILAVNDEGSRAELLLTATRELTRLLGDRGSCILLDGEPQIAAAPHSPAFVNQRVKLERYPEIVAAAQGQEVVAIEDVRSHPLLATVRPLLPRFLSSVVAVPLVAKKRCLGVILIQSDRPRAVSNQAKQTAVIAARLTATLLAAQMSAAFSGERRPFIPVSSENPTIAPRKILLVEDDNELALALAESLEERDYVVQRVADGSEGVVQALAARPDLVLLDVNLPSLDGFAVASQLRESPGFGDTPIIFLSARDDLSARVRAAKLDNIDFMPKPCSREELLTRIERAFAESRTRQALWLHAAHDELTGLGNLRLLRARMEEERGRFLRYGNPLSVAMIDVDKLKRLNDEQGHLAGNRALRAIADIIRHEVRTTDLAARYGGDEFVVVLPHSSLADASVFARRVLEQVATVCPGGVPLTVSIGITCLSRQGGGETDEELLRLADMAAYEAKRLGGNRICLNGADRPVS